VVAAARRRADEMGVENAQFRTLDAERMDLETDSVDEVLYRWGYMLMTDPAKKPLPKPDGCYVWEAG
jgi:ubiquinone/menaquinone biosynthesis C-methylase UbiE